jgi:hypothetical protein
MPLILTPGFYVSNPAHAGKDMRGYRKMLPFT